METQKEDKDKKPVIAPGAAVPVLIERTLADSVLARVKEYENAGALMLPKDFSAGNALKAAWLQLTQTENKDGKPVLTLVTKESIATALLDMVVQGLNPLKKQCYFICYGDKIQMQRSYQGSIAVAKRVSNLKEINAQCIYENDEFSYEVEPGTGLLRLISHVQKFENIDPNKIKGCYCVAIFNDGRIELTVMNIAQIRLAWKQGFGGGNTKAHNNFTDEMCKKTLYNRATKTIINSSDDSALFTDYEDITHEDVTVTPELTTGNTSELPEINMDAIPVVNVEVTEQPKIEKPAEQGTTGKLKGPGFE